jgi:peptidyl-tRNA hydrolase
MPTDAFVLENFTPEERKKLEDDVLPQVDEKIELFLEK